MSVDREASEMSPCYFAASLVGEGQFHRMTVTRIGVDRAQLTGEAPMAAGAQTLLEMNRPTDGRRVRVPIRIVRIRDEGRQFGWKPAFHVLFLEPLADVAPMGRPTAESVPEAAAPEPEPAAPPAEEVVLDSGDTSPSGGSPIEMSPDEEFAGGQSVESVEEVVLLSSPEPPVHHTISVDGDVASLEPPVHASEEIALESADLEVPSAETLGPPPEPLPRRESAWTPWSGAQVQKPDKVDREERVLSEIPVTYFGAGGEHSGMAQDFSRQGLFLAVLPDDPLPRLGEIVRIRFPVPEGEDVAMVGMHGEIRWTHGADSRATRGKGVGLQIVRFDDEAGQQAYQRWVAFLLFQN